MGQFMGENPTERLAVGGCLQTLAKKSHKILLYLRGDE